jgi:hypothetical protein
VIAKRQDFALAASRDKRVSRPAKRLYEDD